MSGMFRFMPRLPFIAPDHRRASSTASMIAGILMLGLSMAGSSSSLWWGIGGVLISASVALTAGTLVVDRFRGLPAAPSRPGAWIVAAVAIPLGSLIGALFFDGSSSVLAVTPVLTVACGVAGERSGARRRTVVAVMCAAGAIAIALLLREGLSTGFATLVQGSVVSGVLVALLIAVGAMMRRWRR